MKKYCKFISVLLVTIFFVASNAFSQTADTLIGPPPPAPPINVKKWGPKDTIITGAIYYQNEWMPYKELEMAWASKMSDKKLAKYIEEWTRLLNAVYVTYPYARTAGDLMIDINARMAQMKTKKEKNAYINARETELKDQFADPLSNLPVYQGKVL